MAFIWWDKLFGTFAPEIEGEELQYGLTKPLPNRGPVNIVMHEWKALWEDVRRAPGWQNKLKYIFYPPGWSHDGRTLTSKQLQAQLENSNRDLEVDQPNVSLLA